METAMRASQPCNFTHLDMCNLLSTVICRLWLDEFWFLDDERALSNGLPKPKGISTVFRIPFLEMYPMR